jgi:hypothetical protein
VVEVEATFKTDAVVLITKKQVLNVSMQGWTKVVNLRCDGVCYG